MNFFLGGTNIQVSNKNTITFSLALLLLTGVKIVWESIPKYSSVDTILSLSYIKLLNNLALILKQFQVIFFLQEVLSIKLMHHQHTVE
jgi:hypothetical protein